MSTIENDSAVWDADAPHAARELSPCRQNMINGPADIKAKDVMLGVLQQSEAKYRQIFSHMAVGALHFDAAGVVTDCNDSLLLHLSLRREQVLGLSLLSVNDRKMLSAVQAVLAGQRSVYQGDYESTLNHRVFALRVELIPVIVTGQVCGGIALVENLSGQRQTEHELRASRQRQHLLREQTALAMIEWDAHFCVRDWNPAAQKIFGHSREQALGQHAHFILPEPARQMLSEGVLEALLKQHGGSHSQNANLTRDGRIIECEWFNTTLVDESGCTLGVISLAQDVTEREQTGRQLRYLARHDSLTGLINRASLAEQFASAIAARIPSLALVFIDLDGFKHINDTLGHTVGDALLCLQAQRLSAQVRHSDSVARLGGDEFILLLPDSDAEDAVTLIQRLSEQLALPCAVEGHDISVTSSIGIALYPQDGSDFDTLLRCADMAMYHAKRDGRNTWRCFQPELLARSARHLQLESALRHAQERGELSLHYQPQYDIASRQLIGLEALLRWQHPGLGWVSPLEFIPVAEESGMIIALGDWVLHQALSQLCDWQQAGYLPVRVAVNLSAAQFQQANLPQQIASLLEAYHLPARLLELELTESVAMRRPQEAVAILDALEAMGIKVSIDDFGTGYSSLSYLKRLSLETLKIDRSFVTDMADDADDRAIVQAIISLARTLGLKTLAEGVETAEQLQWLQQYGCDRVQGYYFSRPLPAGDVLALLTRLDPPSESLLAGSSGQV
ncbi:EAL domain-containing protein [Rhodobacteraceae bacterium CH30]|nr:EAL domain-containing protein [Rhodobacteraceae bacterium CH30]